MVQTMPDIVVLTADELPGILELVREHYHPPYTTEEFWRWRYFENPSWDVRVYGIRDESGRILAMQPVSLIPFVHNGNMSQVGLLTAAITSQAHQRKGFFRALVMRIVHDLQSEGAQFIFTFPNPLSSRGFGNFPGWTRFTSLTVTGRPLLPFAFERRADGVELYDLAANDSRLDDLLENLLLQCGAPEGIRRSGHYLKWRYAENPTSGYWIAHFRNKDESGYALFKKIKVKNVPVGAVVEFNATSDLVASRLIKAILWKLSRLGCMVALRFVSAYDPYKKVFHQSYFRPLPPLIVRRDFPVYTYLLSEKEPPSNWHISWGDMDTI